MSDTDALTLGTKAARAVLPSRHEDRAEEVARAVLEAAGALHGTAQPNPVANDEPSCHDLAIKGIRWYARSSLGSYERDVDLLIADLTERKAFGLTKYGTILQPNNGRDAMADAYAEALDLLVYLTQREAEVDDVMVRAHLRDHQKLCLWLAGEQKR